MKGKVKSIQKEISRAIMLTSSLVLLFTGLAYLAFEYFTFRETAVHRLSIIGEVIATNSTAALAFDSQEEATDILNALQAEPHIVAACLYDQEGNLFSSYPPDLKNEYFPEELLHSGVSFSRSHLLIYRPVMQGDNRLGTLFLRSDLGMIYERFSVFTITSLLVLALSLFFAYVLSRRLQKQISGPILSLARTATVVSEKGDYSVRASKRDENEVGLLTDAFNKMLTEIEQQNASLSQGQERLSNILESMGDAFVSLDREWRYTIVNEKALSLMEKKREDLLGHTLWEVFPDTIGTTFETEYRKVMNDRVQSVFEIHYPTYKMWLEVRAYPHEDGIALFYSDITLRKQASDKIQGQILRLALLSNITRAISERQDLPSIFKVVIENLMLHLPIDFGCIALTNGLYDAVEIQNVQLNNQELPGKFSYPNHSIIPIKENNLSACLNGSLIYESDLKAVNSPLCNELSRLGLGAIVISPLIVESSVFGMFFCARREKESFESGECEFLLQLSEHVALAAHQSQLHEALKAAYDDLRQTQQVVMQQERLRALGQMSSGIAHDINNAISPITLYTESLLENEPGLSEQARGYLEIIQQSIEDVAETVARMKEFYRKREPELIQSTVDLNTLVLQVLELTRAKWNNIPQQKGIVVNVDTNLQPGLPLIQGVESELREALTNLIFNGVDAMPQGGTLRVKTYMEENKYKPGAIRSGKNILIEFKDTGIGMDEETQRKCLEPFFTTKGERGTGLGLAMVYGTIQRHNGEIEIESKLHEGTTFRLKFPEVIATHRNEPQKTHTNRMPSRMRILVIDDDPLILKALQDTLEADGHLVTAANSGKEGIELFRQKHTTKEAFTVVFTDLGMPYIDGRKVAETIKEYSSSTPVILLTGWGQRLLEEGDIPAHVDSVLSKPPKIRELREVLLHVEQTSY